MSSRFALLALAGLLALPAPARADTDPRVRFPPDTNWVGRSRLPLSEWRAVRLEDGTLVGCWVGFLAAQKPTLKETLKESNALALAPCVDFKPTDDDRVLEAEGKKFRKRWIGERGALHIGFKDFDAASDALVLVADQKPVTEVAAAEAFKNFAPATHVAVWSEKPVAPGARPEPAVNPAAAAPLTAGELRWLTRVDRSAYQTELAKKLDAPAQEAARVQSLAADARRKVAANLRPESQAGYAAAISKADATAEQIDAALPAKMWGEGEGPSAKAEIELTAEEMERLKAKPEALAKYTDERRGVTASYDPIRLRLTAVAARAALGLDPEGKPAARPGGGRSERERASGGAVSDADLSEAEQALLTPGERRQYEGTVGAATRKEWNRKLRERIQLESRAPYAPPAEPEELSTADFDKLPLWQKRRFCNDFVPADTGAAAAAGDRRAADLQSGGTDQAVDDLAASEAATRAQGGRPAMGEAQRKAMREKFGELCSKLPAESMPEIDAGGASSDHKTEVPDPGLGADKEEEGKKEKKGPSDHAFNAMRGAILGALIGSLFGPLGAVIGAAAFGAAMYGFSKWKNPDKDE